MDLGSYFRILDITEHSSDIRIQRGNDDDDD